MNVPQFRQASSTFFNKAYERILKNKQAQELLRLVQDGKVEFHYILSAPGAGSNIFARLVYEMGQFNVLLIEPHGQQHNMASARFSAGLKRYLDAYNQCARPGKKVRILVMEKPQHWAPGAEMTFFARISASTTELLRPPLECLEKRLQIAIYRFLNRPPYYELTDFVREGLIDLSQDENMEKAVTLDQRNISVPEKIVDYMSQSRCYKSVTPKLWLLDQDMFEHHRMQLGMQWAIVRNMHEAESFVTNVGRFTGADSFTDRLRHFFNRRGKEDLTITWPGQEFWGQEWIAGWEALADYRAICDGYTTPGTNRKIINYEDLEKNPQEIVKSVLKHQGVDMFNSSRDWQNYNRPVLCAVGSVKGLIDGPPTVSKRAFAPAFMGPAKILDETPFLRDAIPTFLDPVLKQAEREYQALQKWTVPAVMRAGFIRHSLVGGMTPFIG